MTRTTHPHWAGGHLCGRGRSRGCCHVRTLQVPGFVLYHHGLYGLTLRSCGGRNKRDDGTLVLLLSSFLAFPFPPVPHGCGQHNRPWSGLLTPGACTSRVRGALTATAYARPSPPLHLAGAGSTVTPPRFVARNGNQDHPGRSGASIAVTCHEDNRGQ